MKPQPSHSDIDIAISTLQDQHQFRVHDISHGKREIWNVTDPTPGGGIVYHDASSLELVAFAAGVRMGVHRMMQQQKGR